MNEEDRQIQDGKVLAAVGYLWLLCILPLLLQRENRFAQYHGKQGLAIFLFWVVIWIVEFIVSRILGIIPVVGHFFATLVDIVAWLVYVVLFIAIIIGVIQAASGKYWRLPILGAYAERMKF